MSLWSIFLNNRGRVIHKWTHYFPIYERHFERFRNTPFRFLEIGCGEGGSLQMWKHYFGPHAMVIGLDMDPRCTAYEESQIHVRIGDQSDPGTLQGLLDEFGPPDIVLDDGSHLMSDMRASFDFLYPKLPQRSIYMVEDLHTCYWTEFEGGYRTPTTFIEFCKDRIDSLNAIHTRGAVPNDDFAMSTLSLHFYDSAVVFEKGAYGPRHAPQIGSSSE